jgi:putative phage-type endonuclease
MKTITGEAAQQGTEAWHAHRKKHCNASEAGAVMGVNPWNPRNPHELALVKRGDMKIFQSKAMSYGHEHEETARLAAEAYADDVFIPHVVVQEIDNVPYAASLDGISLGGDIILEVKCPYSGEQSSTYKDLKKGKVSEHYWWQVQHQLMVTGADKCIFTVWTPENQLYIEVEPDAEAFKKLQSAWKDFWVLYSVGDLPENPKQERDDAEWKNAVDAYLVAKDRLERAQELEKALKIQLVDLAGHESVTGAGIKLVKTERPGSMQYAKFVKDYSLEVPESYRGKPSISYQVRRTDK